jgi:hypothetical protein
MLSGISVNLLSSRKTSVKFGRLDKVSTAIDERLEEVRRNSLDPSPAAQPPKQLGNSPGQVSR